MNYAAPPYMHDVLPHEPARDPWLHAARWRAVERIFRRVCRDYGYREIRTPVMEQTELFTRSIGQGTDIVGKEMFTFEDRGGRGMTLRPEGTAPVVRAYLEHHLAAEAPIAKLYYIATIYRYEHGQRGRYREHQQTGVEMLGSADPAADAEVIGLALEFYRRLGITDAELRVNTVGCPACRPAYRERLLEYARPRLEAMSADNRARFETNPLRMLDSKDDRDRAALADAPRLIDCVCDECRDHFAAVRRHLEAIGARYTVDPHLVRGFDYYTKTAFELISPALGAQNSIGGGGRYDGLVEELGGLPTPGIGFGIGTERCLIVLEELGVTLPLDDEAPCVWVATLGAAAHDRGVMLVDGLRRAGIASDMDYQGRSLKAQMRHAGKAGARFALIVGDEELASGVGTLRDMREGAQEPVPLADLAAAVRQRLGG